MGCFYQFLLKCGVEKIDKNDALDGLLSIKTI